VTTAPRRSRRADILRAAEQEFARAGFAGGRIERIAASAGVNKQLLFHYFDSKEGLFAAALASLLRRAEPGQPPGDSPVGEVRRVVAELQRTMGSQPGLVAILADARAGATFPDSALALVSDWRGRLLARLTAALAEGQRRGHFRDDLEPAAVARAGLAMALGWGAVGAGEPDDSLGRFLTDACAWR
jgi:TetR/AcrR family transcriptional regulator